MRRIVIGSALLLAACGSGKKAEEAPTGSAFDLQTLAEADMADLGEEGAGCSFYGGPDASGDPLLVSDEASATFKTGGKLVTIKVSAKKQKRSGPSQEFSGKGYLIAFAQMGQPKPDGEEGTSWPARLNLLDAQGSPLYAKDGTLYCGA